MSELVITSFKGEFAFLSNFYKVPVRIYGITFKTAEHAYQARKCMNAKDAAAIINASTPGKAKSLGQMATVVPEWDIIKLAVMEEVVKAKFYQNQEILIRLLETRGYELVEGNTWKDRFWGQCPVGNGENHLGRILMKVRDDSAINKENCFGSKVAMPLASNLGDAGSNPVRSAKLTSDNMN